MTHGYTRGRVVLPEYRAWQNMKNRCYNKVGQDYPDYGAKGIKVCDRWLESFENFFADMGKRPSSKHSIDRFPNNKGNYEPNNCRWATKRQQSRNLKSNRYFLYKNKQVLLEDLTRILKTFPSNIGRMLKHKTIEQVIEYYEERNKLNIVNNNIRKRGIYTVNRKN